jgi:hypothetical protein
MEILRFEDSTSPAPKRKKSSKGYITLGFVAAVFGIGSAFATTTSSIQINNDAPISLGQGITAFTTCDSKIAVIPATALNAERTTFGLTKVTIGAIYNGDDEYLINDANSPTGCGDADLVIKFYQVTNVPLDVCANFTGVTFATVGTTYKCFSDVINPENNRIVFKVSETSHDINFNGNDGTSFFDRISIETTSGTNYSS